MKDGVRLFAKALQKINDEIPDGMSLVEWKRFKEVQETQRYLDRGNSYVVRSKEDLDSLIERGEVFTAAELAQRQEAEQQARLAFEAAVGEQGRLQRHQKPKTKDVNAVMYTRERLEE